MMSLTPLYFHILLILTPFYKIINEEQFIWNMFYLMYQGGPTCAIFIFFLPKAYVGMNKKMTQNLMTLFLTSYKTHWCIIFDTIYEFEMNLTWN